MTTPPDIPDFVYADLEALGLEIEPDAMSQLVDYLDRLLEINQRMNLTAIRDRDAAWRRLIVDSLTILPGLAEVPAGAKVIDIGTGGGLPGIPMAITRPDLRVTLLDATGKKIKFLQDVIDALGLENATAIQARAEAFGREQQHREQYDVVTNRAMGVMSTILEYGIPLLKVDGYMLAMKGPRAEQELHDAGNALEKLGCGEVRVFDAYPEGFDNDLVIVIVDKVQRTAKLYPRDAGVAKRSPL